MIKELFWMLKYTARSIRNYPSIHLQRIKDWQRFWSSYHQYKQMLKEPEKINLLSDIYPCLGDDTGETPIEPIYFYQDTWAFEKILKNKPKNHIDVASHHLFIAFLSKVIPVTMVDIRPLSLPLNTLNFQKGTILNLPFADESIDSLSSLCVVEHIGLGRYGDPLDPEGTEKAIKELKRVIKPAGHLYLSLPIDDENRTYFNAHRAFKEEYLESLFHPLKIVDKSYIYGEQLLSYRLKGYGIGLYHLQKSLDQE